MGRATGKVYLISAGLGSPAILAIGEVARPARAADVARAVRAAGGAP